MKQIDNIIIFDLIIKGGTLYTNRVQYPEQCQLTFHITPRKILDYVFVKGSYRLKTPKLHLLGSLFKAHCPREFFVTRDCIYSTSPYGPAKSY